MIPKLICFIFGHIKTYKDDITIESTGWTEIVRWKECFYRLCPRCGKALKSDNTKLNSK